MKPFLFRAAFKQSVLFIFILACLLSAAKPRPVVWTAIGDSITYLNDHPEQTGNRITREAWPKPNLSHKTKRPHNPAKIAA